MEGYTPEMRAKAAELEKEYQGKGVKYYLNCDFWTRKQKEVMVRVARCALYGSLIIGTVRYLQKEVFHHHKTPPESKLEIKVRGIN
jgi:hypothetical protein